MAIYGNLDGVPGVPSRGWEKVLRRASDEIGTDGLSFYVSPPCASVGSAGTELPDAPVAAEKLPPSRAARLFYPSRRRSRFSR